MAKDMKFSKILKNYRHSERMLKSVLSVVNSPFVEIKFMFAFHFMIGLFILSFMKNKETSVKNES
ncbi:hypothetical protein T11_9896 [Trichinella zimbabwensis]|uniref:Uncharacterized protein n=1 Tax=Trichinella zimbabwensis TaxID=268475 RepID=A0A0V1HIB8_9BILA|nr:hypothetical protein T11_9896 [Trichinella zimbabwensis]